MMHHPEESQSEAAIDTVLAGLRSAQPSPGMERRLLETLRHHAGAPARPAMRPRPAALWSTACALAILMALVALRVPATHPPKPAASLSPHIAKTATNLTHPQRAQSTGNPRPHRAIPSRLREQRIASYPAPPMPLTEQEKLLLRLALKGEPVELAMLMPETRARRDAEGKAEFQKFFEPSTAANPKGETK